MGVRVRLLLHIHPFICPSCLSPQIFKTLKIRVLISSGTIQATIFKFDVVIEMSCCISELRIRLLPYIRPFICPFCLSLQFSDIENLCHIFLLQSLSINLTIFHTLPPAVKKNEFSFTNGTGCLTKKAAMPIYGKTL